VTSVNEVQLVPGITLDAQGFMSGSLIATGLLNGTSIALEVVVEAQGLRSLPQNSRSLPVLVDATPPPAPVQNQFQPVE
jgi:hypothetical protein